MNIPAMIRARDVIDEELGEEATGLALAGFEEEANQVEMARLQMKQSVADALHIASHAYEARMHARSKTIFAG